jgi:hypothetical protein
MTLPLLLFAAVFLLLPLLFFRRRLLARYFACDAALWAAFVALAAVAQAFRITVDPYLSFVAFAVVKLAVVALFLAAGDGRDIRWSANRAAVAALLVYLLMIPAATRSVIDGDEPFYLLMTESLVRDHDLDLGNQFRDLAHSETGRLDLRPQFGDTAHRSHLEPLLAFLMVPGYLLGGLYGAIATICLFGALLVRATIRLFEDEGIDDATARALFPFFAFGPPVLFYSCRMWPEVPGAWMLVEAVRGIRQHRAPRWIAALLGLVLLKLRFALIAAVLLLRVLRDARMKFSRWQVAVALVLVAVPLLFFYSRSTHSIRELIPGDPVMWLQGLFGLLIDASSGIAFQAPFYLGGIFALTRWRSMPAGFRLGMVAAVPYIITLVPRPEWHGGWSPPLRYIVVFMPILALGCAAIWERMREVVAPIALWTLLLVAHGAAFPWRLFHIADGQSFIGESLSLATGCDFGRMLPSMIRPNLAAVVASIVLLVLLLLPWHRALRVVFPFALALALALWFLQGKRPGDRVELEDVSVVHEGGELFPEEYTPARFRFRGGWMARTGDSLTIFARGGGWTLEYQAEHPATIEVGDRAYQLPATGAGYGRVHVELIGSGTSTLRVLSGAVNLDRMDHD